MISTKKLLVQLICLSFFCVQTLPASNLQSSHLLAPPSGFNPEDDMPVTAGPVEQAIAALKIGNRDERLKVINNLSELDGDLNKMFVDFYSSLPVSGRDIFNHAKQINRPVVACNIDNGELSALQIRAFMDAAVKINAFILFEAGPGALLTYADGKPMLPEYCARVAYDIFLETGKKVAYAVHLDHNQINKDKYETDPAAALKVAIDRAMNAIDDGFTSLATDTSTLPDLDDVIETATVILERIYLKCQELGIDVGNEGEIDDIGSELSKVEDAKKYFGEIHAKLNERIGEQTGRDFTEEPIIDVLAGNFNTKHGYTFDDDDVLVPYGDGVITESMYYKAKKKAKDNDEKMTLEGYVIERAARIYKAFKGKIAIALHGFSATPPKVAASFVNTGMAKVNINTDWQAITWKVLEAYYPELYRELFDVGRELAKEKDSPLVTADPNHDFKVARNRIIFGKSSDKAPGARKFFRTGKGKELLEKITNKLANGTIKMSLVELGGSQLRSDYLSMRLSCKQDEGGITASEMIYKLTNERISELMGGNALQLEGSGAKVLEDNSISYRKRNLRLQTWQLNEIENHLKNIPDDLIVKALVAKKVTDVRRKAVIEEADRSQ